MNVKYIVLTGATGILAKHVARQFLDDGYKIIFLGRSSEHESLELRIKHHLGSEYEELLHGCKYYEFSLSNVDVNTLKHHLELLQPLCFLHSAANLSFKSRDRELVMNENYTATSRIYDVCKEMGVPFGFVSTAFVHGNRAGLLKEDELIQPQSFNNYYEESKFLAEKYIKNTFSKTHSVVVFRPGILISTEKSHLYNFGFFVLAKSLIRLRKHLAVFVHAHPLFAAICGMRIGSDGVLSTYIPFVYSKTCAMDLVSTEWVSNAIVQITYKKLIAEKENHSISTFQLSNPTPVPFSQILHHTSSGARISFLAIAAPEWAAKMYISVLLFLGKIVPFLGDFTKKISYYNYYISSSFTHDIRNTLTLIPKETHEMEHTIFYEHTDFFFKR
jgi:nucleoside-diphosphate-sugar epimerase